MSGFKRNFSNKFLKFPKFLNLNLPKMERAKEDRDCGTPSMPGQICAWSVPWMIGSVPIELLRINREYGKCEVR